MGIKQNDSNLEIRLKEINKKSTTQPSIFCQGTAVFYIHLFIHVFCLLVWVFPEELRSCHPHVPSLTFCLLLWTWDLYFHRKKKKRMRVLGSEIYPHDCVLRAIWVISLAQGSSSIGSIFLEDINTGYNNLGWHLCSFRTLDSSLHTLLPLKHYVE